MDDFDSRMLLNLGGRCHERFAGSRVTWGAIGEGREWRARQTMRHSYDLISLRKWLRRLAMRIAECSLVAAVGLNAVDVGMHILVAQTSGGQS